MQGDHRQKKLIERLFQIYVNCHSAFIENGQGEEIEQKVVLDGDIFFGREDIDGDCFSR